MSTAESALHYGDDEPGFDITEEVEVDDLSTQQGGDAIDPRRDVRFEVRKASVRTYTPRDSDTWEAKYFALDLVVADQGVDGEGKYAGKHFFQDLLLKKNVDELPHLNTENYKTKDRFDFKTFLKATGHDPAKPPKVNDDFIMGVVGMEVIADIRRKEKRFNTGQQDAKGKDIWEGTGEFKNEVKNFRSTD